MKSENIGADTSAAEVLNVSPHGFWLLVSGKEYFLGVDDFPWFRDATLKQLFHVELHHQEHLYGRNSMWTLTWNGSSILKSFLWSPKRPINFPATFFQVLLLLNN